MDTSALPLPSLFREALAGAGMCAIEEWWKSLDGRSQREALSLWQDCNEAGSALTGRVEARFADEDEELDPEFWHSDYYDYLVNHEIYLFQVPGFHICTRHPVAAAAARAGVINPDFACPFQNDDCPMRKLINLSSGRPVRLCVVLKLADGKIR